MLVVDALGSVLGLTDPSEVRIAKTASRSVVGHMNEITVKAQHLIAHSGGLQHTDLDTVNRRLRRGLHARGGEYVVPLELATARSA
jgi:exopolysaccharide biosynthesis protein